MPAWREKGEAADLLLVRGEAPPELPARRAGAAWRVLAGVPGWTLLSAPPGPGWTGLPLRECAVGTRRGWLFGELHGGNPEAWTLVVAGHVGADALDGQFLLWTWDDGTREWTVQSDRFGTLHAYWSARAEAMAIGTYHPAVAAHASLGALDWRGLTGFFGSGFFPGDRTHLEDVRILRPASEYTLGSDGRVARRRYWEWSHEPDGASFDRTVDRFAETLGEVVADHAREGRVALPVSGGLDSRCLVAALARAGVPAFEEGRAWAFSYGYGERSLETRIARRVAAARGLPFDAFAVPRYLFERLDQVLACTEGFQDLAQSRQIGVADEIAARADVVLAGHWGDVWLDTLGLDGVGDVPLRRTVDHFVARTYKPADWLYAHLCAPALEGADPGEVRREIVEEELAPYATIRDPDFRIKAFKTDQWSFRWTLASVRAYRPAATPRLPFYDTRLADLFCRVRSEYMRGRRLQIEYLKRHAPDLARVPWQVRGTDLFGGRWADARARARRAAGKAARALTGRRILQRNWEVQFAEGPGRRALEDRLLGPDAPIHDHVPAGEVRSLLERLYARPGDGGLGYQVSMLLTFAVWLERGAGHQVSIRRLREVVR